MDIRQRFAINLRRIRKERRLSQEALADQAGIDRAHVSKIERRLVYVGLEIVQKLAKELKVDPVELLALPEKPTRSPKVR